METENTLKQITEIFREVFDKEDLVVTGTTSVNDIEDWDSLSHIQLVVAIEKQFKIRFTSTEIQSWKNVGEMMESLQKHSSQ